MALSSLDQFPYFTGKMLKAFYHDNYPSTTLVRWMKKSNIRQIEKGKYTLHEDPRMYATTLITPSYCSFRSALYYYQLTNQIPLKLQLVVKKRKKDLDDITFIASKHVFGYRKELFGGFDFFIAEKEKLLLDCLEKPQEGVSIDELQLLLQEKLDQKKIIFYLKKINSVVLIKRTGYLLEKNCGINIYESFKKELEENKNYPKLNQLLPRTYQISNKWRININY